MTLYSGLFGDADVERALGDEALVQAMLDVEAALADALADAGLVPTSSARVVREAARAERYDREALACEAARAGNLAIPLVRQLTAAVEAIDPYAAEAVHLGATSQDILDTAAILQFRAALPSMMAHLARAEGAAARHARRYRDTPMSGRTWLQPATPVTFGLKAAGWLDAIDRSRRALGDAADGAFVLQFGGASGTLASLGDAADRVADALATRLGLPRPAAPWHAQRDRLVRFACALGVLTGTLGKVARDLALLAQPEVAEAAEAPSPGRGGSSTMPHKQNSVASAVALAASVRAPALVASLLAGMPQEHERGLGGWQAEWSVLPELLRMTAGASRAIADALESLVVDAARMKHNLDRLGGLTQAEAVVVALAPHVGRAAARTVVESACRRASADRRSLAEVLSSDPVVTRALAPDALARTLAPEHYLGQAAATVDRVLAATGRAKDADA
jgi:3-carboxy-cis,cis-muconate cycloisomerase